MALHAGEYCITLDFCILYIDFIIQSFYIDDLEFTSYKPILLGVDVIYRCFSQRNMVCLKCVAYYLI